MQTAAMETEPLSLAPDCSCGPGDTPTRDYGLVGAALHSAKANCRGEESMNMKRTIKNIPVVGPVVRRLYHAWINPPKPFEGSSTYWENRYDAGGNSGDGSYRQLAEFKAEALNTLVSEAGITSVIEYGCGDGNQLGLARYPSYMGFDVSSTAISMCVKHFSNDETKIFKTMDEYRDETAELTVSLDVIYHLVEDSVFADYMRRLFNSSERFVVIYSSDTDDNPGGTAAHVRHRNFSKWIANNATEWKLLKHIPNKYPFISDTKSGSFADFYIYSKFKQGTAADLNPAMHETGTSPRKFIVE